ncbi:MAG: hypothetical protein M1826_007455 [Phylliscum demangeonii]|nr:MAG: hypothetical protein M1826_007455 [Phylliscum demangeonii]
MHASSLLPLLSLLLLSPSALVSSRVLQAKPDTQISSTDGRVYRSSDASLEIGPPGILRVYSDQRRMTAHILDSEPPTAKPMGCLSAHLTWVPDGRVCGFFRRVPDSEAILPLYEINSKTGSQQPVMPGRIRCGQLPHAKNMLMCSAAQETGWMQVPSGHLIPYNTFPGWFSSDWSLSRARASYSVYPASSKNAAPRALFIQWEEV